MSKNKYANEAASTPAGTIKRSRPVKNNGYSNFHLHAKRNRKRQEAEERQAAYAKIPLATKLNTAGKKELAKLQKRMAAQTAPQVKVAPLTDAEKNAKTVALVQNAVETMPTPKAVKAKKVAKK